MVLYFILLLNGLGNIGFWNCEEVNECINFVIVYMSLNIRFMEICVMNRYGNI